MSIEKSPNKIERTKEFNRELVGPKLRPHLEITTLLCNEIT
jgi:hypothetical protein